jgi:hypothetical protein
MTLADRIEKRIAEIPASNPGYMAMTNETLGTVLDRNLLRRIAEEAADEAAKQ